MADDARRYAARILDGRTDVEIPPYRTLGLLTEAQAAMVTDLTKIPAAGFDFALDRSSILHIRGQHGDGDAEARRGQRAVLAADYAQLPAILSEPDSIEFAGRSRRTKHPVVRWIKRIGDEEWILALEVRAGRMMLVPDSIYIRKRRPSQPAPQTP